MRKRLIFTGIMLAVLIVLVATSAGCHIAADKSEISKLGPGATWTRVEGIGLDNNTVALVTGQQPTTKASGWITRIDYMKAGETPEGTITTDVHHSFGMDGIQTPLTRQPAVNAVVRQGERKVEITAKGIKTKQEEMKGLGVTELLWWIGGIALLIALVLGAVYYYVPAARPLISSLISKLPGFGHSEKKETSK